MSLHDETCTWPVHRFAMMMMRRQFYTAQQGRCGICRNRMKRNFHSPKISFDHVWPKAWAGASGDQKFLGNLLLTHESCNTAKADTMPTAEQVQFLFEVNRALGFHRSETAQWDVIAYPQVAA